MAEETLKHLKRDELLDMLLEIEQENETLVRENLRLRQELNRRELKLEKAGSLAEASVALSGVFTSAQEAADIYLENVRRLCLEYARRTEELCAGAGTEAGSLTRQVRTLLEEEEQP